jgi:site-specific recombinase XerD
MALGQQGTVPGMEPMNELHFSAYERGLRIRKRSPDTIATYRRDLEQLAAHYPGRDLTRLTRLEIEHYLDDLLARVAATTVGVRFRSLRAFYNWAVDEEIIAGPSPMHRLAEPKATDQPPPVVADANLKALLKAVDGRRFEDRRDTAIVRMFCEPGSPRLGEMARLDVDNVDLRRDHITVHGKGDKVRSVPFGAKTGQAFDRYLRLRARHPHAESPALWLGTKGRLGYSGFAQMLTRRCNQAGIEHIHPHQLRHTAAHVFADSGGSDSDAMELFGWSSPDMPRIYGRSAKTARAHRTARRMSLGDRL